MTFWRSAFELQELARTGPTPKATARVLELTSDRPLAHWFFFDLEDPAWLVPVSKSGRLRQPPPFESGRNNYWPEGHYIERMAASAGGRDDADPVADVILSAVEEMYYTNNPWVHGSLHRILTALVPLAPDRVARIVQTRSRLIGYHPDVAERYSFSPVWDEGPALGLALFEHGHPAVAGDVWWLLFSFGRRDDDMLDHLIERGVKTVTEALATPAHASFGALFFSHLHAHRSTALPPPVGWARHSDADAAIAGAMRRCLAAAPEADRDLLRQVERLRTYRSPTPLVTVADDDEPELDEGPPVHGAGEAGLNEGSERPAPPTWESLRETTAIETAPYGELGPLGWDTAVQVARNVVGEHATSWICSRISMDLLQGETAEKPTPEQAEALAAALTPALALQEPYGGLDWQGFDAFNQAINAARSKAVEVVLRACLQCLPPSESAERQQWDIRTHLPAAARMLDHALDPSRVFSVEVRAVFGRWLPQLSLLGGGWLDDNVHRLFPEAPPLAVLRRSAFASYVLWSRPYGALVPLVKPLFLAELRYWSGHESTHVLREAGEAFARHLMTFLWWGRVDPQDPEVVALVEAPEPFVRAAVHFLTTQLRHARRENVDLGDGAERIMGVLDAVKSRVQREPSLLSMLTDIGPIANSSLDAAWRLQFVEDVYALVPGQGARLTEVGLMDGLMEAASQPGMARRAIDALRSVVRGQALGQMVYYRDRQTLIALLQLAVETDPQAALEVLDLMGTHVAWRSMPELEDLARTCVEAQGS